jgi:hypothetical protein
MKRIINWCSGGIGNRLRPLSTCFAISKETQRTLSMCWQPTMRCMTEFKDLFKNDIETLTYEDLSKLDNVSIYSEVAYIHHDAGLNNNSTLLDLMNRFGCKTLDQTVNIRNDTADNIIVYDNNFFGNYDKSSEHEFLKSLIPIDIIQKNIDDFLLNHKIDKTWIGVHARGTDFEPGGVSVHAYVNEMVSYNITQRFFVCSDSEEYEKYIKENVLAAEFYKKKSYVHKNNAAQGWVNNVMTPKESVQEALVDLYLLSKTDIKIYNKHSTFVEIAKLLN